MKGIIQLPADEKQTLNPEMELKLHEVVFVEFRGIHSPYHARQNLRNTIARRQQLKRDNPAYPQLNKEEDQVAGICQKIMLQQDRFKDLYSSAYKQGLFARDPKTGEYVKSSPWRVKLEKDN